MVKAAANFEMWLACYTQEEIAEAVGCDKATVNRTLEDLLQNGKLSDSQQAAANHLVDFERFLGIKSTVRETLRPGDAPPPSPRPGERRTDLPRRNLSLLPSQENPFHKREALCWSCSRATGCDCAFLAYRDAQAGLQAVQAKALVLETEEGVFYKVTDCPSFKKGPLRPMDAQALLALAIKVDTPNVLLLSDE